MDRIGPVDVAEVAQVARSGWDRAIGEAASRQHGIVTHAQLLAIGLSAGAICRRVAVGRLYPLHRGVYAVGHPPLRAHGHWSAAVLACGPRALLSHASAAALWGLRGSAATLVDVTSASRAGRIRSGIRVHRADTLRATDREVVDGIPCTSVARTIADLAGVLAPAPLEYVIHRAQTRGVFHREEMLAVISHSPKRRGTAALRRILGLSLPDEDELNSELERRLFRICGSAGLPLPQVNQWISLQNGDGVEVDFCWPEQRLVVEADSRTHHQTDRAFENDPRRDRLLTLAGWRVVRFTYRDITGRPEAVVRQLGLLLDARPASS